MSTVLLNDAVDRFHFCQFIHHLSSLYFLSRKSLIRHHLQDQTAGCRCKDPRIPAAGLVGGKLLRAEGSSSVRSSGSWIGACGGVFEVWSSPRRRASCPECSRSLGSQDPWAWEESRTPGRAKSPAIRIPLTVSGGIDYRRSCCCNPDESSLGCDPAIRQMRSQNAGYPKGEPNHPLELPTSL